MINAHYDVNEYIYLKGVKLCIAGIPAAALEGAIYAAAGVQISVAAGGAAVAVDASVAAAANAGAVNQTRQQFLAWPAKRLAYVSEPTSPSVSHKYSRFLSSSSQSKQTYIFFFIIVTAMRH